MPIPHRNIAADQTQISTIGDYVDRAEIERLLNVEYAPYERDGVIWHRYRIDVSVAFIWSSLIAWYVGFAS